MWKWEILFIVGAFAFGVIVSKNLIRWVTLKLAKNPRAAIQDEIDKLKALSDSYKVG